MSQNDRELIQRMGVKPHCPLCHAVYKGEDLRLVRKRQGRYLFYIFCPSCASSIINIILSNPLGVSALYMVTDFTEEDLAKAIKAEPVTSDEVIEVYNQLR
ncbi:hypothetical protein COT68_02920 [bacterium (Candidatus Torokbacteria) CG09_land_8_20_14_0_10_42_11]|nr:MAG: hypothetical protein COT68_02920 [bacterium (Candidatus Torokbacteria) CG09_land_8_20_14_0_10_42_11]